MAGGHANPASWYIGSTGTGEGAMIQNAGPVQTGAAAAPRIAAPPAAAPAPPPPPPVTRTQVDPALTALQSRYNTYLNQLPTQQSQASEIAAQQSRDAAEGGRTALGESAAFRGMSVAPALAAYDATTQEAEQGAIANEEVANSKEMGNAITSGLGVEEAPTTEALAESSYGLEASKAAAAETGQVFNENLAANNQEFNQYLETLKASRMSPIYGPMGSTYGVAGTYAGPGSVGVGGYGMGSVIY